MQVLLNFILFAKKLGVTPAIDVNCKFTITNFSQK